MVVFSSFIMNASISVVCSTRSESKLSKPMLSTDSGPPTLANGLMLSSASVQNSSCAEHCAFTGLQFSSGPLLALSSFVVHYDFQKLYALGYNRGL